MQHRDLEECNVTVWLTVGDVIKSCFIARTGVMRKYWCSLNTGRELNVNRHCEDVLDVFWTSYVLSIYVLCPTGEMFAVTHSLLSVKFTRNYQILQNRFFVNSWNYFLKVKGHNFIVIIGNNWQLKVPTLQEIKVALLIISKFQAKVWVLLVTLTRIFFQFVILLCIS